MTQINHLKLLFGDAFVNFYFVLVKYIHSNCFLILMFLIVLIVVIFLFVLVALVFVIVSECSESSGVNESIPLSSVLKHHLPFLQ